MVLKKEDNPPFYFPVEAAQNIYSSDNIYLRKDSLVIFTCGANSSDINCIRERFLRYSDKYFDAGVFFRAEDAFPVLKSGGDDLLTIENQLADYSDCVLIINESAGTLAELGAFAGNDNIVRKLLVVNSHEYLDEESFINMGPLSKINKMSRFKETMYYDFSSISVNFDEILFRIQSHASRKYRKRVNFSDISKLRDEENGKKLMLLLLQDIINLYSPVKESELLCVLKKMSDGGFVSYRIELSLLIATKKVRRMDEYLVAEKSCSKHSFDVEINRWLGFRKKIIDYYRENDFLRLDLLIKRSLKDI